MVSKISISPFPLKADNISDAAEEARGGHEFAINTTSATNKMQWQLGQFINNDAGAVNTTIKGIKLWFFDSTGSQTATLEFEGYDITRINDHSPSSATHSTTSSSFVSEGTNTYSVEVLPEHTLLDQVAYSFKVTGLQNSVNTQFQGGIITFEDAIITSEITHTSDSIILDAGVEITNTSDSIIFVPDNEITNTSESRIKDIGIEITNLSDSAIFRAGFNDIQVLSDTAIFRAGFVDIQILSNSRIKVLDNEITDTSDSRIFIPDNEITNTSDTIILNSGILEVLSPTMPSAGLRAHYPLDFDGSDSTGSFDGTVNGTPSFVTTPLIQGIDLEASLDTDFVDLGSSALTDNTDITVSAWIKQESSTGAQTIVGQIDSNIASEGFQIFAASGSLTTILRGVPAYSSGAQGSISTGVWHHIAFTVDVGSTTFKLYIDGDEAFSDNSIPSGVDTLSNVTAGIGAAFIDGGWLNHFDGVIDNVRIYNRDLTPSEITTLASEQEGVITDTRIKVSGQEITDTSDTRIFIPDNEFTDTSDTRVKVIGNEFTHILDTRILVLGQETTNISDTRIQTAFEFTKTSDSFLVQAREISRISKTIIKGAVKTTTTSVTTILTGGFNDIQILVDSIINRDGFDTKSIISHSKILNESKTTNSSDSTIFRQGFNDIQTISNERIVSEGTFIIPSISSDTSIEIINEITNTSDSFIVLGQEITNTSDTAIFRSEFNTIDISSDSAIFVSGFVDITKLSDSAIEVFGLELTKSSDSRMKRPGGYTYPFQQSLIKSDTEIKISNQKDIKSLSRIKDIDLEITNLSNTFVIHNPDKTISSDTSINIIFKETINSTIRILTTNETSELSDSAIFRSPSFDIINISDTEIFREPIIDLSIDSRILDSFEFTHTSDSHILVEQEISILSGVSIFRSSFNTIQKESQAIIKRQTAVDITKSSDSRIKVTITLTKLSNTSMRRDRSNLIAIFQKGRQL